MKFTPNVYYSPVLRILSRISDFILHEDTNQKTLYLATLTYFGKLKESMWKHFVHSTICEILSDFLIVYNRIFSIIRFIFCTLL